MKKTGFTLAELLITLGIIGVVSALTFSIATKLMPDKNKVLCLKAFDTVSKTVKELAADSKIYPTCKDANSDNNVNCKDFPLFNTNRTSAFNNDLYSGDKKLCSLLAYSMGVNEANISCSDTPYAFNADSFNNDFSSNLSFTTQNGMQWRIVPQVASSVVGATGTYQTDIYVDVNGSEAPNCIYNNDTCEKPDRFKFMVAATGQVYAADPYSVQYVTTRKSFLKTKSEIDDSSVIVANLPQDRTFALGQCRTPLTEQERCAKEGKYWYDSSCHDEPKITPTETLPSANVKLMTIGTCDEWLRERDGKNNKTTTKITNSEPMLGQAAYNACASKDSIIVGGDYRFYKANIKNLKIVIEKNSEASTISVINRETNGTLVSCSSSENSCEKIVEWTSPYLDFVEAVADSSDCKITKVIE